MFLFNRWVYSRINCCRFWCEGVAGGQCGQCSAATWWRNVVANVESSPYLAGTGLPCWQVPVHRQQPARQHVLCTRPRHRQRYVCECVRWRRGVVVSINEVNIRWARLVLVWVTVSDFDSQRQHFISVCIQLPRSTQPSTLRRTVKWVPAKGRWCSAAGSKGRHGVICR